MSLEYSFNLSVPLDDVGTVEQLLDEARGLHQLRRVGRKPDRNGCARFYLSFPFSGQRPDLKFQQWFEQRQQEGWELYGPTHGRWGLA
jgi:hypothetical protein